MGCGDCDPEDLPAGWDPAPEEGTVAGPSGAREPEPAPRDVADGERGAAHRRRAEQLRPGAPDADPVDADPADADAADPVDADPVDADPAD